LKRSHAVNSSFCEVNKARLAVSKDRRQVDRRQRKVVLQQLQGTHFFGLLRSVRSLARHRGGTAHRKAWPIALREEGCCKELPFFFCCCFVFFFYGILFFLWSPKPVTSVEDLLFL